MSSQENPVPEGPPELDEGLVEGPDAQSSAEPLLPADGVLLHIGPHKTGTTALQSAFDASSQRLRHHGVAVTGLKLQRRGAAAVLQRTLGGMALGTYPDRHVWERLCARVAQQGDRRVLVSSEIFSDAGDSLIAEIVSGLGGSRVRVLITVRPLEKLLPSTWQQAVKTGAVSPYDRWLRHVLKGPDSKRLSKSAAKFWSRHDHARLAERWAQSVGHENVAVLIVDEGNPGDLLRDMELLIGVPAGTLQAGAKRNRSLTAEEAEAVRQLYLRLGEDLDRRLGQRWVHHGAVGRLIDVRRPPADEPRLVMPATSTRRAREIGREIADRLVSSGVRIVGDPEKLVPDKPVPEAAAAIPTRIDDDVAVEMLVGLFRAAEADLDLGGVMEQVPAREMLREVGRRAGRRLPGRPPARSGGAG